MNKGSFKSSRKNSVFWHNFWVFLEIIFFALALAWGFGWFDNSLKSSQIMENLILQMQGKAPIHFEK